MSSNFLGELKDAVVKIIYDDSFGTGFFISSDTILTCAHVIKKTILDGGNKVNIKWKDQLIECSLIKYYNFDYPDLALLKVPFSSAVFFSITEDLRINEKLFCYGYSKKGSEGDSITFELEGEINKPNPFLKLKGGQAEPGFSGSPIVSIDSKNVIGVLKYSRDINSSLGGHAISGKTIYNYLSITKEKVSLNYEKAISSIEIAGLHERLELLLKKKIFFEISLDKIYDVKQEFAIRSDLSNIENQISSIKESLDKII